MAGLRMVSLLLLLLALAEARPSVDSVVDPPKFGDVYHISGVLLLPYAEIEEPFKAWFNLSGKASRIDYYGGQVLTYQHASEKEFGIAYKITPETTEDVVNVKKCFQINGTSASPVATQAVIPDLTGFQPVGSEVLRGRHCTVWRNVTYQGKKKATYTLWVGTTASGEPEPVRYEMRGFNTLLGSHVDKYNVDYHTISHKVDPAVFELPKGTKCVGFPGPGAEHSLLANPMAQYVPSEPSAVDDTHQRLFEHFTSKHGREYSPGSHEHERRKTNFVHNLRFVHSANRANRTYTLALNHLADRSVEELALMRGRQKPTTPNNGRPFPAQNYVNVTPPDTMDWRLYGAVTPVKDQACCGSCWSFATTGTLEGSLFLKTGQLIRLSQQMLVDCTWGFGNNACDGGEEWRAFEWIMKHGGISTADTYGPYQGQNGFCHYNKTEHVARIDHYVNVTSGDEQALRLAIFKNGPVAVSIDAGHLSFAFYSNGVYYEPKCHSKVDDLNHAVLGVGYGTLDGEAYWLVKNSWSTYWGNDGYVLMSTRDNNCGVTTDASYAVLA